MNSRTSETLTLIGVVHRDPMGEKRVLSLLWKLRCDMISLEVSPYALSWRLANGLKLMGKLADIGRRLSRNGFKNRDILRHGEIQILLHMLDVPFEVRAAAQYARSTGARFFLLDDSEISAERLTIFEQEILTLENVETLLQMPDFDYMESIELQYEECRRFLEEEPIPGHRLGLSEENRAINEQRDAGIEKDLMRLRSDLPGRWVHVCGFTHLLRAEGFRNIAARFPDAKRILAIHYPGRNRS